MEVLKNEITLDPLGRGYSEMPDSDVATSLNAKNIPVRRSVKWSTVYKYAMTEGFWPGVVAASKDPNNPVYKAALAAVELKDIFRDDVIDTGLPLFKKLSGVLVAAGLMTTDQMDALIAMGDTLISRAEQLGLARVRVGHVNEARR